MSKPIVMWAAIVQSKKSEWINDLTLRKLKKETIEASKTWDYCLASVRFARVEVKEIK